MGEVDEDGGLRSSSVGAGVASGWRMFGRIRSTASGQRPCSLPLHDPQTGRQFPRQCQPPLLTGVTRSSSEAIPTPRTTAPSR